MSDFYLWLKAFHIIAVFAWMAGLFYLPRIFVYHARSEPGGVISEQFKIMEYRLARTIMLPAGVVAWALGLATAARSGDLTLMPNWLLGKLVFVVMLTGFHVLLERYRLEFWRDRRIRGERYFRLINEIPTVLLVLIVLMVVVKPI